MAIFYMRTSIIKASSGKSAVASAAYQAAQKLYNERLGQTFEYRNKEEVIFSEVLLPENAPDEFKDREKLWNAVEKKENKVNSRYARQFVVALPNEWSNEECIERSREFIQEALVSKGMCADWAFHEKIDKKTRVKNNHIHIQCTVRGFDSDGKWSQMEKKTFALDENGEKIPEIDPKTGEQKVRVRTRNGRTSTERLWKRITVQSNDWNSRRFVKEVKRQWAETCNKYLPEDQHIEYRSYKERGINRVPLIHEAPGSREKYKKNGFKTPDYKENEERREINQKLAYMEQFILEAKRLLDTLKNKLKKWREYNEKTRSQRTTRSASGDGAVGDRISGTSAGSDGSVGTDEDPTDRIKEKAEELERKTKKVKRRRRH